MEEKGSRILQASSLTIEDKKREYIRRIKAKIIDAEHHRDFNKKDIVMRNWYEGITIGLQQALLVVQEINYND